jgi:hypothetical protein
MGYWSHEIAGIVSRFSDGRSEAAASVECHISQPQRYYIGAVAQRIKQRSQQVAMVASTADRKIEE